MIKIKLVVSYDGTGYHGWQKQDDVGSVQEVLEKACEAFFHQKIEIKGAGRTDAGVHALGQCASFTADTPIPMDKVALGLNRILPSDIVVTSAQEVPLAFHPQYCAKSKTYQYQLVNAPYPIPQMRHYAGFVYTPLDVEAMKEGATYFVGNHDFASFCAPQHTKKTTSRIIHHIKISQTGPIITIEVCGNGFLYHMVRIMVGTLVEVGKGKIRPEEIPVMMALRDRQKAGPTMPACGLTMCKIEY